MLLLPGADQVENPVIGGVFPTQDSLYLLFSVHGKRKITHAKTIFCTVFYYGRADTPPHKAVS